MEHEAKVENVYIINQGEIKITVPIHAIDKNLPDQGIRSLTIAMMGPGDILDTANAKWWGTATAVGSVLAYEIAQKDFIKLVDNKKYSAFAKEREHLREQRIKVIKSSIQAMTPQKIEAPLYPHHDLLTADQVTRRAAGDEGLAPEVVTPIPRHLNLRSSHPASPEFKSQMQNQKSGEAFMSQLPTDFWTANE